MQVEAEEEAEVEVTSVEFDGLGLYGAVDALHMKVVMVTVKVTCSFPSIFPPTSGCSGGGSSRIFSIAYRTI